MIHDENNEACLLRVVPPVELGLPPTRPSDRYEEVSIRRRRGKKKKAFGHLLSITWSFVPCAICVSKPVPRTPLRWRKNFEHSVYDRSKLTKKLNTPGSKNQRRALNNERDCRPILYTFLFYPGDRAAGGHHAKRYFRSAIWLLFSLTGIAGLYFWLQMEFIAAVQIVVYVGGIVVLIIFSIFLTQQSGKELPAPMRGRAFFFCPGGRGWLLPLPIRCCGTMLSSPACILPWGRAGGARQCGVRAGVDAGGGGRSARKMLSMSEHGYVLPF